jgi:predicted HTH domain antitoxin
MQVTLKIPDIYFTSFSQEDIGQQIKLYTALMMFYNGKVSAGAACEIAEIDRFVFIEECKKNKIPIINYSIDDIQKEIANYQYKSK